MARRAWPELVGSLARLFPGDAHTIAARVHQANGKPRQRGRCVLPIERSYKNDEPTRRRPPQFCHLPHRRPRVRRSVMHGDHRFPNAALGPSRGGGMSVYRLVLQFAGLFALSGFANDRALSWERRSAFDPGGPPHRAWSVAEGSDTRHRAQAAWLSNCPRRQMALGRQRGEPAA